MYEMIAGHTPFADDSRTTMYSNILNRNASFFPIKDTAARELISMLLKKDPKVRAGFNEIKSSKYFEGFNWDKIEERNNYVFPSDKISEESLKSVAQKFAETEIEESDAQPVPENFGDFEYMSPDFEK